MSKLLLQGSKQQRLKIRRSNTPAKLGADVLDGVIFLGGDGGAYRDRTDDLLNANQALSQLS